MTRQRVTVVLQNASAESDLPAAECFAAWVRTALADAAGGELAVRVVDRSESRELNRTYRGRDRPTNVLAFPAAPLPAPLPPGEPTPLGDLVLCAPLVRAEARARGIAEKAHWAHLVVHGCLHLLGFDHQDGIAARAMEARESALLAALGFADPYRTGS